MDFGKILSYAGAAFFVVYGVAFSLFPYEMATLITDAVPASSSAAIDMRSTYGGLSIAVGVILVLLAGRDETIRLAVTSLLLLMLGMASARLIGLVVDGEPNIVMFIYLGLEIGVATICGLWLYQSREDA